MSICIGGCCIPYNAIWPLLLLILQPVWGFVSKLLGLDGKDKQKPATDTQTVDNGKDSVSLAGSKGKVCDCCVGIPDESPFTYGEGQDMEFEKVIMSGTTVFVRFTASWCKPCKAIEPEFNTLAKSYQGKGHFMAVDIDDHDAVAASQGVVSIPAFIAYRDGERLADIVGASKEKLRKFVEANANL